jgi:hypothetical protein
MSKEKVCLPCRARVCRVHDNPVHGMTEAECALEAAKMGFEIVPKGSKKPATVKELEKVVDRQTIDAKGYVMERRNGSGR